MKYIATPKNKNAAAPPCEEVVTLCILCPEDPRACKPQCPMFSSPGCSCFTPPGPPYTPGTLYSLVKRSNIT